MNKPYEGNEPYIFVSYAHKDKGAVYGVVARLQNDGYRVWYDEGIDPGTEWDENIADHIVRCGYVIAFITQNYLNSDNCKDELNFARDIGKNRLLIYCENVALPYGMAMRLNRLQAIHKYTYSDEERFYEKLYSTSGLEVCHVSGDASGSCSTHVSPYFTPVNDEFPKEEAIIGELHRYLELAADEPERFEVNVADCYYDLAVLYRPVNGELAANMLGAALGYYRRAVERDYDEYKDELMAALCFGIGGCLEYEKYTDMEDLASEAAALMQGEYELWGETAGYVYEALAQARAMNGRVQDSINSEMTAYDIYKKFAERDPDRYEPDIARVYYDLAVMFEKAGHSADAKALFVKAFDTASKHRAENAGCAAICERLE